MAKQRVISADSTTPEEERTGYVVYVDMDDVLCDYRGAYRSAKREHPEVDFPQSIPGFFENLRPINGAVEAVRSLQQSFDVYVLTAPSTRNPRSYMEKRIWIEEHFDYQFTKKLILCANKGLLKGRWLIDDNVTGKGQDTFEGEVIHFGSTQYPDWLAVLDYIAPQRHGQDDR
ncbi:MAG: hypothetical protein GC159_22540 [Phycisphaera sp.]|nr:hypothetical protein [Phycisphaera sp.]